jgi:hypothetical protein
MSHFGFLGRHLGGAARKTSPDTESSAGSPPPPQMASKSLAPIAISGGGGSGDALRLVLFKVLGNEVTVTYKRVGQKYSPSSGQTPT